MDTLRAPIQDAYYAPDEMTTEQKQQIDRWLRRYIKRSLRDERPAAERIATMNATNPKYVLRNYLAQLAIDDAEKGDGSAVMELLEILRTPYTDQPGREKYAAKRPEWARHRVGCSMLSCSS